MFEGNSSTQNGRSEQMFQMEIPEFNYRMTGGSFNKKVRILQTFTILLNEKNGCYLVHDDRQAGALVSAGWKTIDQAVRAHQWEDDQRVWA